MKISDEIQLLLDDHILNIQQISFSPFKEIFNDEVDDWALTLKLSQDVIVLWMEVQKYKYFNIYTHYFTLNWVIKCI
jgi:dynein heavy chain